MTNFGLKSTLPEVNLTTLACFWAPFALNIFFHPFALSLYLSLPVRYISYRQQMLVS
jgi:hypothetical protein